MPQPTDTENVTSREDSKIEVTYTDELRDFIREYQERHGQTPITDEEYDEIKNTLTVNGEEIEVK